MAEEIEYTHRTTEGLRARITCRNRKNSTHPVMALIESSDGQSESYICLTSSLHRWPRDWGDSQEPYLREVSPWEDVPVDTLVWVYDSWGKLLPAYFAGYTQGHVHVWSGGRTSITSVLDGGGAIVYKQDAVFLQKPE